MTTKQQAVTTTEQPTGRNRRITLRDRLRGLDEKSAREQVLIYLETHSAFDYQTDFDELFEGWFRHTYRRPALPANKVAINRIVESGISQIKKKIEAVAGFKFMEIPMPNGKTFGDCTLAQARDYGGKTLGPMLERIGRMAKDHPRSLVRNVFTEDELFELFRTSGSLNNPRKGK